MSIKNTAMSTANKILTPKRNEINKKTLVGRVGTLLKNHLECQSKPGFVHPIYLRFNSFKELVFVGIRRKL